jgi:hypothetical protein
MIRGSPDAHRPPARATAPLRSVWRGGRNAILLARNLLATPHPRPVFVLGNQKSGTSAIAALLGLMTGLPTTVDLRREVGKQYYKHIVNGERSFDSLVQRNRLDFSRAIVKEPNLTLFLDELRARFPESRFLFVVREPHQNLRSILDRLAIRGDLPVLERQHMTRVDPGFELVLDGRWIGIDGGDHYIDRLCARWNRCVDVYQGARDQLRLVRYEDFQRSKLDCLESLAAELGLPVRNDVRASLDRPFQPPGRSDVDLRAFFGANYDRITAACGERMACVGYPATGSAGAPNTDPLDPDICI